MREPSLRSPGDESFGPGARPQPAPCGDTRPEPAGAGASRCLGVPGAVQSWGSAAREGRRSPEFPETQGQSSPNSVHPGPRGCWKCRRGIPWPPSVLWVRILMWPGLWPGCLRGRRAVSSRGGRGSSGSVLPRAAVQHLVVHTRRGLPSLKARPAALPASELLEPPSAFPALLRVLPRPLAGCGDPFLLLPRLLPVRPRLPTATRSTDPLGATSGKPQKRSEGARPARQAAALPRSQFTGDPDGPGSLQPSLSPLLGSSRLVPAGQWLGSAGRSSDIRLLLVFSTLVSFICFSSCFYLYLFTLSCFSQRIFIHFMAWELHL